MHYLQKLDGLVLYVGDVAKTAEFYRTLGFDITRQTADMCAVRLGGFWLDFHSAPTATGMFAKNAAAEPKGAGLYIYVAVQQIDNFYQHVLESGLTTAGEPQDQPWGNREFVVRDPDGYQLAFYQKV